MLVDILKFGGTTALAVAVLYLLYRQMIVSGHFKKMSGTQTFLFFSLLAILIFLMLNLVFGGPTAITFGDGNHTTQG